MLMSHCSLRAIRHLPFLWVIGTSCSSGSGLLTWTFSTIRYSYSVSSSLLKLREGLNNVTSSLVHAVPYLKCMRAAGGIRLCGRAGRNRACSRANAGHLGRQGLPCLQSSLGALELEFFILSTKPRALIGHEQNLCRLEKHQKRCEVVSSAVKHHLLTWSVLKQLSIKLWKMCFLVASKQAPRGALGSRCETKGMTPQGRREALRENSKFPNVLPSCQALSSGLAVWC